MEVFDSFFLRVFFVIDLLGYGYFGVECGVWGDFLYVLGFWDGGVFGYFLKGLRGIVAGVSFLLREVCELE